MRRCRGPAATIRASPCGSSGSISPTRSASPRLRQACGNSRRAVAPWLWFRRNRHHHAAAAARQSAPAHVPARCRPGRDQSARLQFGRRGRRPQAAGRARQCRRHCRHQCRRQQGFPRPGRRLCAADRALRIGCELCHRQYFLAQHAGPAQYAAGVGARRPPHARGRRPRTRGAERRPDTGAPENRAAIFRSAISTMSSASPARAGSMA